MEKEFLNSYVKHLINCCHRRGAYAMGGMSAFLPNKDDLSSAMMKMQRFFKDYRQE